MLHELKQFCFEHNGDEMGMWKDSPDQYEKYRLVDEDVKEQWRQELISEKFHLLSSASSQDHWITVDCLYRRIARSKTNKARNFEKLLNRLMELSPALDKRQKILILEHFAGRTASQKDGGIYYILSQTNLRDLLKRTIEVLSDFSCDSSDNLEETGWQEMEKRYSKVKSDIQKAFRLFDTN